MAAADCSQRCFCPLDSLLNLSILIFLLFAYAQNKIIFRFIVQNWKRTWRMTFNCSETVSEIIHCRRPFPEFLFISEKEGEKKRRDEKKSATVFLVFLFLDI